MAVFSTVLQLVAAMSSLTFVLVTGVEGLLGLGPAIFLAASALAAMPAGRAMDRIGRRPVIAGGFAAAAAGCSLTALARNLGSTPLVILGFALTGAASGIALLIRTAAGDIYPPERRARGISYVLFGSVFGALLGPAVFGPLFAGKELEADALTLPWLAAGVISLVALALVLLVRPDPQRIAELIAGEAPGRRARRPPRRCARSSAAPASGPPMLAALASFGVMVSVMNLSGYVVVEHHHHGQDRVFPVIGAHVFGMYALVLVVGALIDRDRPAAGARRRAAASWRALDDRPALDRERRRRPPSCCSASAWAGTSPSSRRPRALADRTSAGGARPAARLQRPAVGAAGRGAGADRRLRARLDRRRRAGHRGDAIVVAPVLWILPRRALSPAAARASEPCGARPP